LCVIVWTFDTLITLATRDMHMIIAKTRDHLSKFMSMAKFPTKHEDQFDQIAQRSMNYRAKFGL
jgi:hypothetical protein